MTRPQSLLHQATCVAIGSRAILIEGPPGSGKSSLALGLIDRGAVLIGDDGVLLTPRNESLLASPPPHTSGMIELRNVGIITVPITSAVAIALVLQLDCNAPRFVDAAEVRELAGVNLPLIRLWPDSPVLALRAEAALARYGAA